MTPADQARDFFPKYKVYVFGADVTGDTLSVSTTHNDARAPSTASIDLANQGKAPDGDDIDEDRYIITNADIVALNSELSADLTTLELPEFTTSVRDLANQGIQAAEDTAQAIEQVQKAEAALAPKIAAVGAQFPGANNTNAEFAEFRAGLVARRTEQLNQAVEATRNQSVVTKAKLTQLTDAAEAPAETVQYQVLQRLRKGVPDELKQAVLATKVGEKVKLPEVSVAEGGEILRNTVQKIDAFRGFAPRYPFRVGDCIFHSNDPIRIFYQDPRDPETWYHSFAGYVSDWVDNVSENNERIVTLRAEDAMRSLRYARFTTNPGIIDPVQAILSLDLAIQTFASDNFNEMNLVEFLYSMVFGFIRAGTIETARVQNVAELTGPTSRKLLGIYGESIQTGQKDAGGFYDFDKSQLFVWGDGLTTSIKASIQIQNEVVVVNDLGIYQAVVDHQVRPSDLQTMALSPEHAFPQPNERFAEVDLDPVTGAPLPEAIIRIIGEHPERYPIEQGLTMLIPSTVATDQDAGPFLFGFKGPELSTTLITRLGKIFDICERVEFSFYATPKGQLIAEMPLNDFDPYHFGSTPRSLSGLGLFEGQRLVKPFLDSRATYGPFEEHYKIARKDTIRWSRAFSDESVRTLVVAQWNPLGIPLEGGLQSVETGQSPGRRVLTSLIPQFGVRKEDAPASVRVADKESAELYAQLILNRFNSNANTADFTALPQLRIMPNRPILFTVRNFIGTCREVSQTINWAGDAGMTLKVNYIRSWDGLTQADGRLNYAYLGGFRANVNNYALISKKSNPQASSAVPNAPNPAPAPGGFAEGSTGDGEQ